MPWKATCPMDERVQFVMELLERQGSCQSFSAICRQFGVARKTGYKWWRRYEEGGFEGLVERSRAPRHCPWAVPEEVEALILALRGKHGDWGPATLIARLERLHRGMSFPAVSTVAALLKRNGLVRKRRKRTGASPSPWPLTDGRSPNAVWAIDFKGEFRLGNGRWCYPLTVSDHYSRYLLCCQSLPRPEGRRTRALMERLFREVGLPEVIRSDNGAPFASVGLGGLSRLSVWWLRLGIRPERIEPGKPQQNGRHERLHRTLKKAAVTPPKTSFAAQQRAFDTFEEVYNHERPHHALGLRPPADFYHPSPRPYPERLPELCYPHTLTVRIVCEGGYLRWRGARVFLGKALAHQPLGLEAIGEGQWRVHFGPLELGLLEHPQKDKVLRFRTNPP